MKSSSTHVFVLACVAVAAVVATPSRALDPRFPDWPCQQLKVPKLTLASVWRGPSIEGVSTTPDDPKLADLVATLAARRTPMEDARRLIDAYVTGTPAERQAKAGVLFAALFGELTAERDQVMSGLERFSRKEKALAQDIRARSAKLHELEDANGSNPADVDDLSKALNWEIRVFDDRRKSTTYVCEVPVIIERRLYELGQEIEKAAQ